MLGPRVALWLTLNIFRFYLGTSLTVFNPNFPKVIQKSGESLHTNNRQTTTQPFRFISLNWEVWENLEFGCRYLFQYFFNIAIFLFYLFLGLQTNVIFCFVEKTNSKQNTPQNKPPQNSHHITKQHIHHTTQTPNNPDTRKPRHQKLHPQYNPLATTITPHNQDPTQPTQPTHQTTNTQYNQHTTQPTHHISQNPFAHRIFLSV